MSRFETGATAVMIAIIAVTTVRNIMDMRKFELVAIVVTVAIMGVTLLRDFFLSRQR